MNVVVKLQLQVVLLLASTVALLLNFPLQLMGRVSWVKKSQISIDVRLLYVKYLQ